MRALILGCLAVSACGGSSPASPSSGPSLRLTAAITQSVVRAGETATLTFRLENTGASPVVLRFPSACQIMPYIAASSGEVVYPGGGEWGCALVLTSLDLPPGGSRQETLKIGSEVQALSAVHGLPPGDYLSFARVDGPLALQSVPVAFSVR